MPDDMPPALLVERFDIRAGHDDMRLLALEDMASLLGVPTEDKYTGTMERIAGALRPLSTDADADLLLLLKRALFAWLIADGDMHLKNMAVLKIAEPGSGHFNSVRMAPLDDAGVSEHAARSHGAQNHRQGRTAEESEFQALRCDGRYSGGGCGYGHG
jgi:serine/threonine-protein kinase HipA